MRSKFPWHIDLTEAEKKDIWERSLITVDANVLLDLYRFHENTRNEIIGALEKFKNRLWISHQAANEFFENRKKVISDSTGDFDKSVNAIKDVIKALSGAAENIRSNRQISPQILEDLSSDVQNAVESALGKIEEQKKSHPDFLKDDSVLEKILNLFEGCVGDPYDATKLAELYKIGKERHDSKMPPGYMDSSKEGNKKYNDFILWRQVLDKASVSKCPIVLVTSDRKEDWFQEKSGKLLGPRHELLKEAWLETGQRILILHTPYFIKQIRNNSSIEVAQSTLDEVSLMNIDRERKIKDFIEYCNAEVIDRELVFKNDYEERYLIELYVQAPVQKAIFNFHFDNVLSFDPIIEIESNSGIPFVINSCFATRHGFEVSINPEANFLQIIVPRVYRIVVRAINPALFEIENDGGLPSGDKMSDRSRYITEARLRRLKKFHKFLSSTDDD